VENISSSVLRIEEEIKRIRGEIKEIKENMRNMATKEDIRNMATKKDIDELKNRIDELEGNFQRENRRLRDRISDLEDRYETIIIRAKMAQRLVGGPIAYPPMTFAEDSTFCDEYKIATYREKSGLL